VRLCVRVRVHASFRKRAAPHPCQTRCARMLPTLPAHHPPSPPALLPASPPLPARIHARAPPGQPPTHAATRRATSPAARAGTRPPAAIVGGGPSFTVRPEHLRGAASCEKCPCALRCDLRCPSRGMRGGGCLAHCLRAGNTLVCNNEMLTLRNTKHAPRPLPPRRPPAAGPPRSAQAGRASAAAPARCARRPSCELGSCKSWGRV